MRWWFSSTKKQKMWKLSAHVGRDSIQYLYIIHKFISGHNPLDEKIKKVGVKERKDEKMRMETNCTMCTDYIKDLFLPKRYTL